jgi:3'(2'), 5'-bisphosphate nucleotidase
MIGLCVENKAVLGVVSQPALNLLYSGVHHTENTMERTDAYLNERPLRVREDLGPGELVIVKSQSHGSPKIEDKIREIQNKIGIKNCYSHGSVGLKISQIAEGRAHLYFNLSGKCSLWDLCAPQAILEGAGGLVLTESNLSLRYDFEKAQKTNYKISENFLALPAKLTTQLLPFFL